MPHSHNIDYYLSRMDDESLAEALADFEDPLEGRSLDLLSESNLEDEFCDETLSLNLDEF